MVWEGSERKLTPYPILLSAVTVTSGAEAADATYAFNIPEGPLADTLRAIGHQTTMNIVFAPETVDDARSPPIRGDLTVEEAVTRALSRTKLQARQATANSILIEALATSANAKNQRFIRAQDQREASDDPPNAQASPSGSAAQSTSAPNSSASSESSSLEEVIVTAQKRAERLIDVPISMAVLGSDELQQRNITDLQDLQFAVPNLSVYDDGYRRSVEVRGISNNAGGPPLVGMYLDESDISMVTGQSAQLDVLTYDLERVEVLRGPQGTLFGAGSAGGTVRLITKDPQLEGFGFDAALATFRRKNDLLVVVQRRGHRHDRYAAPHARDRAGVRDDGAGSAVVG